MIDSCERLHAMLRDLGIDATVGEANGTLLVYVPNRYQYKRAIAAVGETVEGEPVAVHRVGRIKPAVPA